VTVETRNEPRSPVQTRSTLSIWWHDPRVRGIFWQVVMVAGVALVGWYLVSNTLTNLERQNIASGFGFLEREAGFAISESPIGYAADNTYARAFVVGILNTFKVAVLGILFATILGTIIGVARLSSNWLVAKLSSAYVEVTRNIPLLLQLFIWYGFITVSLPHPREAANPLPGVFFSNRGAKMPVPEAAPGWTFALIALGLAVVAVIVLSRWAKTRQEQTGQQFPIWKVGPALIVGLPFVAWLIGGAPTTMNMPELTGFRFQGGITISPEFAALFLGLSIYTAGFIAEIVRSGILAVSYGQTEAAAALGLRPNLVLRLIVLPQALRVIIPPTTSQYLNLTKNSSLAVAIGYPDLVSIGNTTLNQTGQAIEAIAIFMAVYLVLSLSISLFMNWYNKHIALVER
jgi:general L-amino acid transport system permease protein